MKLFVTADIHGFYDEFMKALNESNFIPNDPNHLLISLGDAMDRGNKNLDVIKYLTSIDNKILIRGNHEDLLERLINRRASLSIDVTNGTLKTLVELAGGYKEDADLEYYIQKATNNEIYNEYKSKLINYFETKNYIFVHGWVPSIGIYFNNDWRCASEEAWSEARWTDGSKMTQYRAFEPNKCIVCGHWHCSKWHMLYEGKGEFEDFSPYISKEVIALDACTAYSKIVNVLEIEDDLI